MRPHKQTAAPQLLPEPMRAHAPPNHRGGAGPVRWLSLSAVLLALAGASAGGAALVLRRRRSPGGAPDAAELELEAELQEMIAEERAKRVPPLPRS